MTYNTYKTELNEAMDKLHEKGVAYLRAKNDYNIAIAEDRRVISTTKAYKKASDAFTAALTVVNDIHLKAQNAIKANLK